jgi:hypothetical protein
MLLQTHHSKWERADDQGGSRVRAADEKTKKKILGGVGFWQN